LEAIGVDSSHKLPRSLQTCRRDYGSPCDHSPPLLRNAVAWQEWGTGEKRRVVFDKPSSRAQAEGLRPRNPPYVLNIIIERSFEGEVEFAFRQHIVNRGKQNLFGESLDHDHSGPPQVCA